MRNSPVSVWTAKVMRDGYGRGLVGLLALAFLPSIAPSVVAQERAVLEEVMVTATRRETDQQTTAMSITSIAPEQMEKRFMTDIRGVADLAPNVVMENVTRFNAADFAIRGTGTNDIITTVDTAIGVVIDGFALAHSQSQLLDSFDLASIEILRGPQGTLFGKNTTGGVVNVRTKRPEMNEFGAEAVARAGNDGMRQIRFAANVPLMEDKLAARFMYSNNQHDGFYRNYADHYLYGTPALPKTPLGLPVEGDGRDLGGVDVELFRGKLLWEPSDNYSALLSIEYFDENSPSPPSINETPLDGLDSQGIFRGFLFNAIGFPGIQTTCAGRGDNCIYETGVSFRGDGLKMEEGHRTEKTTILLEQSLDVGQINYNLLLGYLDQEERLPSDYTGVGFPSLFDATRNVDREQFQAELRMTTDFDGPLNFTAGAGYFVNDLKYRQVAYIGFLQVPFLFDGDGDGLTDTPVSIFGAAGTFCDIEDIDAANGVAGGDLDPSLAGLFVGGNGCLLIDPGGNDRANYFHRRQDGKAIGIYLDGTYALTDRINLTLGTRFSDEEKDYYAPNGAVLTPEQVALFDRTNGDESLDKVVPLDQYAFVVDESASWDGFSFRAGIDYQFSDDVFSYFMFSDGFKSGSFVESCASFTSCSTPFNEETATQFEVGLKADLLDRTLRINSSVFFLEFEDVVRSQVVRITNQFGQPDQETQFRNIAGQENWGAEVEATWYPLESLKLSANAGYLDCKYTEFETDLNGDGVNDDASGLEPNFCPEYQLYADGTYDWELRNGGRITLFGSVHHTPESEYSVFNSDFTQLSERTLVNASIAYEEPEGRWRISAFGNNLTDEVYRTSANSVAGLWNFSNYGPRRQMGVEVMVKF